MWPDDGLEVWERDGYAEAMYEAADNARKAARENRVGGSAPQSGANPGGSLSPQNTADGTDGKRDLQTPQMRARDKEAL